MTNQNERDEMNPALPARVYDNYWAALKALRRLERLGEALEESYSDDVIIRCELTAGDIRAVLAALYPRGRND